MASNLPERMRAAPAPLPTASGAPTRGTFGRRRGRNLVRTVACCVGVALVASLAPSGVTAQSSDDAAKQAAAEIQAARDRANAAADAFFQAQSDLAVLQDDAADLQRETDDLEQRVGQLRRDVESIALARFAKSGAEGIPLLTGLQAPKDQVRADVLVGVISNAGSSSIDEFEAAQEELGAKRRELGVQQADVEAQQAEFTRLQDEAEAEVKRLREIEEQRLTNEAVKQALAEQQAAALAKLQEVERRNAEAAAKAQPNPGIAAAQAAEAAAPTGTDPDGQPVAPVVIAPVTPSSPTAANAGPSGGSSGGRTGTGGPGSAPIGVMNGESYVDNIFCPVNGSAYGDSWGGPRSGGRHHEGVDMLAPTGTPVYAVTTGTVVFKQNQLGGNAASLTGDNGNRYYYAHFSHYEGASRRVERGEVIAYIGDTGNAVGTPHLHFEVHPAGGLAVNPTPSVRAAGC